tara:strand:- start:230 stop:613 length:384 start_codon:yes stop_codon:yes gene_type:complete
MFEKFDQVRQDYYETFIGAWQQSYSLIEVENRLKEAYERPEEEYESRRRWDSNPAVPGRHTNQSETYRDPADQRCKLTRRISTIEHTMTYLVKEGVDLKPIPARNNINWSALHEVMINTPTCLCDEI